MVLVLHVNQLYNWDSVLLMLLQTIGIPSCRLQALEKPWGTQRSTLFVAAVRSCYGESCLLHGVDWMPPKGGVTEEQMLQYMGANTHLTTLQAEQLNEDENVGFAYLSLQEARPSLRVISFEDPSSMYLCLWKKHLFAVISSRDSEVY